VHELQHRRRAGEVLASRATLPTQITERRPEMWGWNVAFEYQIWKHVGPRFGFPPVPKLKQFRCSMALSCYFGMPAALAVASTVMGGEQKDTGGYNLIRLLTVPCRRTKKFNKTRRTPETHPQLFEELYRYCDQDVVSESDVRARLPRQQLPDVEQRIWYETTKSNFVGVRVDLDLVKDLKEIRDTHTDRLVEEFTGLCGLAPTQTVAFKNYLLDEFLLDVPNLQKQTVEDILNEKDIDPTARRLLEIRASASQVAGKKLDAIERTGDHDGRIRDILFYYGAGTGRFAGRQVQLQNLARGKFKVSDSDPAIFKGLDPDDVDILYGVGPMEAVGTMIRPCITCDEGKHMYDADYASVEARGVAWLAGQDDLLRLFSQGQDVYKYQAAKTFGGRPLEMDDDQRFLGKQQILGCGYQCGWERFQSMCGQYGVDITDDMAKHAVQTYRGSYTKIVDLWAKAQEVFMTAIRHPNRKVFLGPVTVAFNGKYLFAQLPSGRTITYAMPSIVTVEKTFDKEQGPVKIQQIQYWGIDSMTRKWSKQYLYGGKIVENLVQGICRDLMCYAIVNLIDAGFQVLFHVHDQIISQHDSPNSMSSYIKHMTRLPQWARGFPLAAEGKVCQRFSK